ncbi:MAG TPA: PKD domain-containing protein [Flavobacteriales bacterium]|nr:PKD domain-containing protein [Flavobacteriales bacterium]
MFAALSLAAALSWQPAQAQNWHTVGTATAANANDEFPTPFANHFVGQRMQSIYLASELSAAGLNAGDEISSISWNVADVQGCGVLNDYTVRIAHTTATTLSGFLVFPSNGASTTPVDYQPVLGDNTFHFRSNFVWDGTSNLLIQTTNFSPPYGTWSANAQVYSYETGAARTYILADDKMFTATQISALEGGTLASTLTPVVSFGVADPCPSLAAYDYTLCQGGTVPAGEGLTAAGCAEADGGLFTAVYEFPGSNFVFDGTSYTVRSTLNLPPLPEGAVLKAGRLILTNVMASGNTPWSNLYIQLGGEITGAVQLFPGYTTWQGTAPEMIFQLTGEPAEGNITLATRKSPNTTGTSQIGSARVEYDYTLPTPHWYTTASGGTPVASGISAFDPVSAGLVDPNVVGSTTFYVACGAPSTPCADETRTPVTFNVVSVSAPVATAATGISDDGFTANWNAVSGATEYYLDVSTSPTFGTPGAHVVGWNFSDNNTTADSGIPANASKTISTTSTGTPTYTGGMISNNGWNAGNGTKYWMIDLVTTGHSDLTLSSVQRSSNTGPKNFKVQFRIGATGPWHDVPGASVTVADNTTTGVLNNIALPAACNNQPQVFLRWIMTSNTSVNNGTVVAGGTSRIDNISVNGTEHNFVPGYENLSVSGTSQAVTGLDPETTYYYRVRANTGCENGPNSNVISVTTAADATPELSAGTLAGFGPLCLNTEGGPASFTVTGTNLTTADVTVGPLSGFTFSTTEMGTYAGSLSLAQPGGSFAQDIWVKFTPTAVQSYDGNIVVGGGGATDILVAVTGSGINTPATASTGAASQTGDDEAEVQGSYVMGCSSVSAYGIEYSTTSGFTPGTGTQVAATNASGGSFSSTLTGLALCTPYYYRAYATDNTGTSYGTEQSFTNTVISVPVALAATDVTAGGFTANWSAVAGATGYQLDVSTSPTFGGTGPATYTTGFDGGRANLPTGWSHSGLGTDYTTNTNYGVSTPSLKFDDSNDRLTSPVFDGPATSISYWYKGQGTNGSASALLTEGFNGSTWETIGTVTSIPSNATGTQTYTLDANDGYVQFRFTYTKDQGNLAFDDFNVTYSTGGPDFVPGYENLPVAGTSQEVTGLDPETTYYYRVRATSSCATSGNSNTESTTTTAAALIYYSQNSGNVSDAIWATVPVGTPGPAVFNANTSMVVQNGHVVDNNVNTTLANLTVDAGGIISLNSGTTLSVHGDQVSVNGQLTSGDNTSLILAGANGVILESTHMLELYNLEVNTPNGALTDAVIRIHGTLQLTDGELESEEPITLVSTASGTARLGVVGQNANYVGELTMQRYIPAGQTNWRMLGSPVAGATILDWKNDFYTAGFPGSHYPSFDSPWGSGVLWPSIRWYDETVQSASPDVGIVGVSGPEQPLQVGQGFLAWCGDNLTSTMAFTVDVTGAPTIAKTPIALPMSFTSTGTLAADGWNLVGNPLPSAISFNTINRGADVQNAYWVFDPVAGNNKAWTNGVGQGAMNGKIQSSQGFWMKANGTDLTTTVDESAKVNEPFGGLFGGAEQPLLPILGLEIASSLNSYSDEATIVFAGGTPAYGDGDALKMGFRTIGAPRMAVRSTDGQALAIDFFGSYNEAIAIPLAVDVDVTGTYTITASLSGINSLGCLSLLDQQTGAVTPLTDGASYTFHITAGDEGNASRFVINGTKPVALAVDNALCHGAQGAAGIVTNEGPINLVWTDAFGNALLGQSAENSSGDYFEFQAPTGAYMVFMSPAGECGQVAASFTIGEPAAVEVESLVEATSCPSSADGLVELAAVGGTAPYTFAWPHGAEGPSMEMAAGEYVVTVTDANGCTSPVQVTVPAGEGTVAGFTLNGEAVAGVPTGLTNTSILADQYFWDFGDGSASTEETPVHTWALPGNYTVSLTASSADCIDTFTMEAAVGTSTGIAATAPGNLRVWGTPGHIVIEHPFGQEPVNVDVHDATGRLVLGRNGLVQPVRIQLSDRVLGTGVWFVRVTSGDVQRTFRVPLVR